MEKGNLKKLEAIKKRILVIIENEESQEWSDSSSLDYLTLTVDAIQAILEDPHDNNEGYLPNDA